MFGLVGLILCAHPALNEGQVAFEAMAYRRAIEALEIASQSPQLTADERYQAFDLLAKSYLALGQHDDALETYVRLLLRDPHASSPAGAPKVKQAFQSAKERLYSKEAVTVEVRDTAPQFLLNIIDPWAIASDHWLYEQNDPKTSFRRRQLVPQEHTLRFTLSPDTRAWYFEVFSSQGSKVVGGLGSAAAPQVVSLSAEGARPLVRRPLPWLLATISLICVGAMIGLHLSSSSDSAQAGQQRFASDRKAYDDSAIGKAIAANVFGGAAGIGALAAVFLWVF